MRKGGAHLTGRIQEFELWRKDGDFFKEGEYAKRRAQRRERGNVLEGDRRLKRWKKLYVPAVLGMTLGSFLTLASTVHGLGKNTLFWSSKEVFHIIGPVFLIVGLAFLMFAAACSHREEEKLRVKLGLPSMFPQKIRTLPSEENTSITTVSELDSSHSLSERLAARSKDRRSMQYNFSELSAENTEGVSLPDANTSLIKSGNETTRTHTKPAIPTSRHNKRKLMKRNISLQSDVYSIASDQVFEHENEIRRVNCVPFKETDIDAYSAALEEKRRRSKNKSASINKSDSLPNMTEHDLHTCTIKISNNENGVVESHEPLLGSQSEKRVIMKSKNFRRSEPDKNSHATETKKEKSRAAFGFHRLVKGNDRFLSTASETSSGYSSGTNMVDTEHFECFTSFDSEPEGDVTSADIS